uniref:SUEL-type lectin domain-containing protein n=1 Tax=Salarias fasciatus TaxID=181472 RepID=A0A672GUG4_SALFA
VQRVTCEHSMAHLRCDEGLVISIHSADFGRRDQSTCSFGRPDSELRNTECFHHVSLIAKRCNGKNSCSMRVSSLVFGDPCYGTYKYLEYLFIYFYNESLSSQVLYIGVIRVQTALYGRRNREMCSEGKPPRQLANIRCSAKDTLQRVKSRCNGKQKCSIKASKSSFGDPCRGTYKYLEVAYVCLCK